MNHTSSKIDKTTELEKIKQEMKRLTQTEEWRFNDSMYELFDAKSKMLRPLFLLASAKIHGMKESTYELCAAVELLHIASLVHDDIIDDADLRRGVRSTQAKYGKPYALIMGDYLFTRALSIIASNNQVVEVKESLDTVVAMTIGEVTQYFEKTTHDYSLETYYRIVDGKTSALFSLALLLGASGTSKREYERMAEIGRLFGRAFQIRDDLKDLSKDSQFLGKPLFQDLSKGQYTLPVLLAVGKDESLKNVLKNLKANEIPSFIERMDGLGVFDEASQEADKLIEQAMNMTYNLKSCTGRDLLLELLNYGK